MTVIARSDATAQRTERKLVILGDSVGKTTLVRKLWHIGPNSTPDGLRPSQSMIGDGSQSTNSTTDPTIMAVCGVEIHGEPGSASTLADVMYWNPNGANQTQVGNIDATNAHVIIVMCDATSVHSANHVANHIQNGLRISPGARVIILCNLFDSETKQPAPMSSSVHTILNQTVAELGSDIWLTLQTFDLVGDSSERIYNSIAPEWLM
jgi:hypothetical protein